MQSKDHQLNFFCGSQMFPLVVNIKEASIRDSLRLIKDHFKVSLQVEIKVNREAFHLESPLDELLL